ncbi:MAG TPA: hypothetical protein VGL54_11275 [Solirubrobacteraceae bacterium]|jgi:hypothetical protein
MTDAEQRQIEWGTAEIESGILTVALFGAAGKAWSRRFDGVLALLGQGEHSWGEIKLRKNTIEVGTVSEGAEADLRHLLESVVLEVNSHFEPDDAASQPDQPEDDERRVADARDEQMTATFRAFAGDQAKAGAET